MILGEKMEKILLSGLDKSESQFFENRIVCEWLSSAQTAAYLGISENALRIMVYRRQIEFSKIGRRLRFHINDVLALFSRKEKKR